MTAVESHPDVDALEARLDAALRRGDAAGLDILGYGEISSVLRWSVDGALVACKRLPLFDRAARVDAYAACFGDYLAALTAAGVDVLPSRLYQVDRDDGTIAVHCVQPMLAPGQLATDVMRAADRAGQRDLATVIVDRILATVGPRLGLDGQLSNWAMVDGGLRYLDVTTPMLRDDDGRDRLDADLFLASLPWALRGLTHRFLLRDLLAKYYQPRAVVLDLLGNLHKERLSAELPALTAVVGARVTPPLERAEIDRYYRGDARTWGLLQRLRRFDRAWQRKVRRRPYPFLLPGRIER